MATNQPTTIGTPSPPTPRYPFVVFGPKANCTLDLCPVQMSVYGYRPSLAANYAFIACLGLACAIHLILGVRTRSWWFMGAMCSGCVVCIVGYVGRIMLYYNPWSFVGFMLQIILVGSGPVFFSAAIYVTLSKLITFLDPAISRIPPQAYIWIFLLCDVVALTLQAVGGGLSTSTHGQSQLGVDLGLAGLVFQVVTMLAFSVSLTEYLARYLARSRVRLNARLKLFLAALAAATILILGRSAYRVEELSKGYSGPSIRNEPLFIGLEGVVIVVAVFCLCVGHPGLALEGRTLEAEHNPLSFSDDRSNSMSPEEKAHQSA
ncbi:hypothetical protein MAPG_07969 [Magnaporthiopsis poae ATCC 64411]|uniref:Parasitic phase-specific protein PSP-1 n=1 Tax=Magnaporthiopsis poae (strain ATCC 64411 / 73-15) TaxID=644358 RepID=A0A0C4E638_MAGP6|nr:hypothetical protein MAPG_07969 [Magnaporthiopsis poae ATCC 64411]